MSRRFRPPLRAAAAGLTCLLLALGVLALLGPGALRLAAADDPAILTDDPFAEAEKQLGLGSAKAEKEKEADVSLVAESPTIVPGQPFRVAVKVVHAPKWHTYWENPGATNLGTKITWTLPEGFTASPTRFALPHFEEVPEVGLQFLHEGTVYHFAEITPPAGLAQGEKVEIKATAKTQACDPKGCMPPVTAKLSVSLTVAAAAQPDAELKKALDETAAAQPKELPQWQVKIEEKPDHFLLTLAAQAGANADPGNIHLADRFGNAAAKPLQVTQSGGNWMLKAAKPTDKDLPPMKGSKGIDGFLYAENGWTAGAEKVHALKVRSPDAVDPAAQAATASGGATKPEVPSGPVDQAGLEPGYDAFGTQDARKLTLWSAALLAFLGGMILNLMPCVFPVLGIKVLGFVKLGGQDNKKILLHGIAFSLGLLLFVWAFAAFIIVAKASFGKDFNWGFQLKSPGFMAFIVALLFVMGLWLAGLFEFGSSLTTIGGGQPKKGYAGSFFSGILTTLIATPCSGPFLGAAMGFALQQSTLGILFLFTMFGLGIASPYLILSAFPPLIRRLPKPGAWMDTFKKLLAYPMFAAAAFFLNTFGELRGRGSMSWFVFALVLVAFACFIFGHWCPPFRSRKSRILGGVFAVLLVGCAVQLTRGAIRDGKPEVVNDDVWKNWSPQLIADLRRQGRILFVDYTTAG